ncbi:MAG: hypothetical protein H6Q89_1425 [Myxococcaceae bacterium]|nr:hypothetical protein [Myxococcaceae bacterium]
MSAPRGWLRDVEGDKRRLLDERSRVQLGLVTRAQVLEAGYSSSAIDRRLASGEFEPVCHRVYRMRGGPAESAPQSLLAACLSLGSGTVASHRSAAWLWGLDGFNAVPRLLEVTTLHGRRVVLPQFKIHQRREALTEGYTHRAGVPVTVLTRTLLDLAPVLSEAALEIALDSAARGRPEFFFELDEFLCGISASGRKGINRLSEVLKLRIGGAATGSPFETELFQVLRRADIPLPILQLPVFKEPDRPFVHIDFAWPSRMIALFPDGGSYHQARRRARLDASQRLELIKLGWKPIVLMPGMLKDPGWIASFAELFWPADPTAEL